MTRFEELATWWLRRRGYKVMRVITFAEALARSKERPSPLARGDLLAPAGVCRCPDKFDGEWCDKCKGYAMEMGQ